ncbi:MAG: hypothetical protein KDI44_12405 [Thiothrix sp.]|nr:hypothetical protein [Thiothrix sp.]HPQ96054.1 hypothetical protein [Thiolinea sp.]
MTPVHHNLCTASEPAHKSGALQAAFIHAENRVIRQKNLPACGSFLEKITHQPTDLKIFNLKYQCLNLVAGTCFA